MQPVPIPHPLRPVLFLLIALALLSCRLAERAAQDGQTTGVPTAGPVLTAPPAGAPLASSASTQSIYYTQTFDSPTVSGWSMDAVNDDVAQVQRDLSGGAYRWRITALQDVFSWMYPGEPASLPSPYFW